MTKPILPIALVLLLFACNGKSDYFNGFGKAIIGNSIDLIANDSLHETENGIYTIKRFKLSDEVGYAKNLQIKTDHGEIYHVSFNVDDATNSNYIDSILLSLLKYNMLNTVPNPDVPIQFVQFSDGTIHFAKAIVKTRIGNDSTLGYTYFNIKKTVE